MRLGAKRLVPAVPGEVPTLAVLQHGRLTGMGRSAACELLAWRTPLDSTERYTRFRVIEAPEDLPDGVYLVEFDGRCCFAAREAGHWKIEPANRDVRV